MSDQDRCESDEHDRFYMTYMHHYRKIFRVKVINLSSVHNHENNTKSISVAEEIKECACKKLSNEQYIQLLNFPLTASIAVMVD